MLHRRALLGILGHLVCLRLECLGRADERELLRSLVLRGNCPATATSYAEETAEHLHFRHPLSSCLLQLLELCLREPRLQHTFYTINLLDALRAWEARKEKRDSAGDWRSEVLGGPLGLIGILATRSNPFQCSHISRTFSILESRPKRNTSSPSQCLMLEVGTL